MRIASGTAGTAPWRAEMSVCLFKVEPGGLKTVGGVVAGIVAEYNRSADVDAVVVAAVRYAAGLDCDDIGGIVGIGSENHVLTQHRREGFRSVEKNS